MHTRCILRPMIGMFPLPLFLLPLILGTPHFQLQSSLTFAWIPILEDGPCKTQCEAVRSFYDTTNNRKGKDFRFRCSQHYDNTTEIASWKSCIFACDSCTSQVYVDENAFHCPPPLPYEISGKCKDRCDANRRNGQISDYSFSCQKDISADKQNCPKCEDCPSWNLCSNGSYDCPSVNFEGVCKNRCDENRKPGEVDGFVLKCEDQSGSTSCQDECNFDCPNFVCRNVTTPLPDIKYYCPQAQLTGHDECRELCDKFREGSNQYNFYCTKKHSYGECSSYCSACPDYVCPNSQIRPDPILGDDIIFHCPPLDPNPFFPRKKSYKGKCKERCEQSRGGGPFSFKLNCESTYISVEEKNLCKNVCSNECPKDTCLNGDTILCKTQNREGARLEREKEEEKNRTKLERENELKELKDTIDSRKTWIFVLAMMIIFASFGSIGGVIVAWRVLDVDGKRHGRPDKHTSALGRMFFRRKKQGRIVPYQPLEAPAPARGDDVGVGPIIQEE